MTEIESRELTFRSWKSYAKFLGLEVSQLQQLVTSERVSRAFNGAKRQAREKGIPFVDGGEA